MRPYLGWYVFLGVILLIAEVAGIFVPLYYKQLFDGIDQAIAGDFVTSIAPLTHILVLILAIHAIGWFFSLIAHIINNSAQPKVMADIERSSFDYLLGHSNAFFANNFTGSLVRKVRRLSRAFEDFSDVMLWELIPLVVVMTGSLIVIWFRSTLIVFVTLGWILFFTVVNYFVARWRLKYDEKRSAKDSEVTGVLADALTNIRNIQLFTNKPFEKKAFEKITSQHRNITTFSWNVGEVNIGVQYGLMIVIEFLVMAIAVRLWSQGMLTIGDFALLQGYLVSLFMHIRRLGHIIRRTYEAFADAKEMVEILETPQEVTDSASAESITVSEGGIVFENVNFSYRKTRHVFKKFNLEIKPREKVALVGPSGSGKTTIVQLILRMYNIQRGKILIDGQPISRATQESLRKNIALVPQDPVLFHRSLMENIRYGNLDATDEEVMQAAEQARCTDFIDKLPEGYDTFVGERGIKLSGGERQRSAIARAILKNAPILILDEATSSLDSESERYIQDALEKLMRDKTTIVIAHRLSTILKMDRIIVMSKGDVVDTGTHTQLARKKGLYQKLWKIQSEGFMA